MQDSQKPIIILDANAFISSNHLLNLGSSHRLVTTSQVLNELRDQKTRSMLKSLPFELEIKQASKQQIENVRDFARKTGDIGSLSDQDIGIIALAYRFYMSEGLKDCLRTNPQQIKEIINQEDSQIQSSEDQYSDQEKDQIKQKGDDAPETVPAEKKQQEDDGWITVPSKQKQLSQSEQSDMDSQEGWVTPQNYQEKMAEAETIYTVAKSSKSAQKNSEEQKNIKVALMSADYAVQNVATQMGIKLLSLDGRKISSIRRFVWQCYLCWKQYKITENKVKLCSNCGYNSLSKIAYSITSEGKMIMHRKKGWKPNQKVLQWKQKKYQQQQKRRKHQYPRKKKAGSIFDTA